MSHRIDTGDHPPIREAPRRHPQVYTEQIDANIDKMLQQGVIEPCSSEWSSNVVLEKLADICGEHVVSTVDDIKRCLLHLGEARRVFSSSALL